KQRRKSIRCSTISGRARPRIFPKSRHRPSWSRAGPTRVSTRGTFEGFKHIASKEKYLVAHGQKKWAHYYVPENMRKLHAFFDHFLKGIDYDLKTMPKVTVEVREKNGVGTTRAENEGPIARTEYTRLYLDASKGTMQREPAKDVATASYDSIVPELGDADHATFDFAFDKDTELTGYMKLRVFMSCEET